VAAEYQEHFGEHAYDDEGNYIGSSLDPDATSEGQEAWEQYYAEQGFQADGVTPIGDAPAAEAAEGAEAVADEPEAEPVAEAEPEA
jgi:small subunit ribosomal protein S1